MSTTWKLTAIGILMMLALGGMVLAKDHSSTVVLSDKAAAAFKTAFPTAKVIKVEKETEHGVEIYGIEFKDGSGERDCDITPDGTIIEISEEIDARMLPKPVLATIDIVAPSAKLGDLERTEVRAEAKDGHIAVLAHPVVRYEAKLEKGERYAEIVVAEDGKIVMAPVWKDENEEKDTEKD